MITGTDTREQIMDAFSEQLSVTGYPGISLVGVARTVGIRKPSIYHHFPGGKEELHTAVAIRFIDTSHTRIAGALAGGATFEEQLTALVRVTAEHAGTTISFEQRIYDNGARPRNGDTTRTRWRSGTGTSPSPPRFRSSRDTSRSWPKADRSLGAGSRTGSGSVVRSHPVFGEVGQDRLVGLPAVGELHRHVEVDRLGRRVGVQQLGDARPGHHDAGVPVPRGQHAQPARLQVERGGVAAARTADAARSSRRTRGPAAGWRCPP